MDHKPQGVPGLSETPGQPIYVSGLLNDLVLMACALACFPAARQTYIFPMSSSAQRHKGLHFQEVNAQERHRVLSLQLSCQHWSHNS